MSDEATRIQKFSWIMYDWANSGYGLIVISAVFPPFFISRLLPVIDGADQHGLDLWGFKIPGSAVMGILNSVSMALMAVAAPVFGAIADIKGWTKRFLTIFALAGSLLTTLMYFLDKGDWLAGAVLFVITNVCFGSSFAFYNAFLPRLTSPDKQGSLSGLGFAVGYIGGAIALILALWLITTSPEYLSLGLALSGIWWLVFSIPAIVFLKEFPPQTDGHLPENAGGSLLTAGFRRVGRTFRNIRQYRMLFIFLVAFLLYNDGVETVISMSSAFGTDVLKMNEKQLIVMLLIVQFVAFGGASLFGYVADRIGNKPVIMINLAIWMVAAVLAFFVNTPAQFQWLGVLVGMVLGGVQASSRALMASLAPREIQNEAFGFFSVSGKFASIFGPLFYAGLATGLGPRYAIFSVIPFLIFGFVVMLFVIEPKPVATTPDGPGSRDI